MSTPNDGNFETQPNTPDVSNNPSPPQQRSAPEPAATSQQTQSTSQQEQDLVDWQAKYNGLQGHAKQMKQQRDEWFDKYQSLNQQLEAQRLELESKLQEITQSSTEAASELEQLRSKVNQYERQSTLRQTIRENYSAELLQDFEDGLLRLDGLEGDDLTSYLDKYAERMSTNRSNAIRNSLKGSTPPAANSRQTAARSLDELKQAVMQAAPNSPESREAWAEYKAALAQQQE